MRFPLLFFAQMQHRLLKSVAYSELGLELQTSSPLTCCSPVTGMLAVGMFSSLRKRVCFDCSPAAIVRGLPHPAFQTTGREWIKFVGSLVVPQQTDLFIIVWKTRVFYLGLENIVVLAKYVGDKMFSSGLPSWLFPNKLEG
jgi:hypothetical protein